VIRFIVAHRLRAGLRSVLGGGLALGLVLGIALAGFASARTTASAYDRVLAAADAETAVVSHQLSPEEAAAILDEMPEIARHRYNAGFVAYIADVDGPFTGGVLAPAGDEFPLELPVLRAGRLPDPDRADEVFINSFFADEADVEVGQELTMNVLSVATGEPRSVPVTVAGIGIFPREAVADDTVLTGIVAPSRAFHEEHEDLRVYSNSRIWLDDPGQLPELAQALSGRGIEIAETREAERRGVEEALRPSVTVLIALGVLAGLATVVVAVQVAQRRQERWRADDEVLSALGTTRGTRSAVHLAVLALEVVLAALIASGVMLLASPRAPIGPLHDLDPGQGVALDATVAALGILCLAVVLTVATLALVFASGAPTRAIDRPTRLTSNAQRPSSLAGLSLALHGRRRSGLRLALAATAGAALLAGVATVVQSSRTVIATPQRYGVDFDLLAINAFGDQTERGIARAFGGPGVTASTSFTNTALLVDGRTVPGLGVTTTRGDIGPTIIEGDELRHDDEVVLGIDTADRLEVDVGDEVAVQAAAAFEGGAPPPARDLRVVGLATFAAIAQQGVDEPRLGVGALVTRPTLEALSGSDLNRPEWTVARLAEGTTPDELIAANPEGIEDEVGIPTRWFTQARPAELVQLDAAEPVLLGAVAVSLLLLAALIVQGGWARARTSGSELSVLQALGCSRQQLARAAAWLPMPAGLAAVVVGVPLGVAAGRLGFSSFARSVAVVDDPSSPAWLLGALVVAVLVSVAVAALVAGHVARRVPGAATLRDAPGRRG
jgi:ABC-type lipoprotein release transport system permease subunit